MIAPSLSLPHRFFRALVPRSRFAVPPRALLSPAIFLLLYIGLVFAVEVCGWLHFTWKPAFFLLLSTVWVWWLHVAGGGGGLGGWRAQAALHTRLWLIGVFIGLLAEPRAVRTSDALALVYALDVSDSMGQKVSDESLAWIQKSASLKPANDEAGLVVFGREAAVELPPRTSFPFESLNSIVPRDGTNLAKGLRTAAVMLPEGQQGRVVLISDGNQTDGQVFAALDELKSRGIPVDVLRVNFDFQKEVWLERLDLPRVVKQGETYDAAVLLSSLRPGKGKLRLAENGKLVAEKDVTFAAGKTRFSLAFPQRGPGYYEYVATIEPPPGEDSWSENNQAIGDVYLKGEGKILVVTDSKGDSRDWESLVAALKASERSVQVRMAYEVPRDALSLLPYDLIILPNAPAYSFDAVQMQAMHDAVFNLGTGLLMLGSKETFGPGGYQHSVIEDALPVTMEVPQKKVLPSAALLLVLDRSGSMSMPAGDSTKLGLANRGATFALKALGKGDQFGVHVVDTQTEIVLPVGLNEDRDAAAKKILATQCGGGGIYIYTSLIDAAKALRPVDAGLKHVILFADAADAEQQTASEGGTGTSALDLASAMAAAKTTVSVVALGNEKDKDTEFLHELSVRGQGRFYLTGDARELPQIFIKEAMTIKRSMLQDKTFIPEVAFPSPVLKGIDAMPPLHGYVLTTAKPTANIILQAPPLAEELVKGDLPDPVLATWRYGLGATAAWTSDFSPNWAKDWMGWEKYRAFIKQLVTEISRVETKNDLSLTTSTAGSLGMILVEDYAKEDRFVELAARVSGPHNETLIVPLKQIAARRYQGQFPLWGKGRYQVAVAGASTSANGKPGTAQAFGGFAVPYSSEYLRFQSDPILLEQIAQRTGGRLLTPADVDLFHPERHSRESSKPIFDWFLIVLACLVPLDVAMRRVQLDWSVIKGWFSFGRRKESTATMGALLQRKKQAQAAAVPAERPKPIVLPTSAQTSTPLPPSPPKPITPPATAAPANGDHPQSTTERLLARKRKRDDA